MIPLKPLSVKLPDEVKLPLKEAAGEVGFSINKFILESLISILEMIPQVDNERLPKIVVLVRAARQHRLDPQSLKRKPQSQPRRKPACQAKKTNRKAA